MEKEVNINFASVKLNYEVINIVFKNILENFEKEKNPFFSYIFVSPRNLCLKKTNTYI